MSDTEKTAMRERCAVCGAEAPAGLRSELCPKCLLEAGFRTEPLPVDSEATRPGAIAKGLPGPGERFGHYNLIRLLGQGGMGVVYEAEDLDSGRRVALKVLGQTLDSPEAREQFLCEGQLAASINHLNSVYVYGTEEIAGTPAIAMELLPGGTLQDRVITRGPLPVAEAVDCTLQIVAGLEAAQRAGVLHRDIKPSNCFVDHDGAVKIGDFGLSIRPGARTEPDRAANGSVAGTPAFSSPEQLHGDELTVRSDIYAVGATLYYLLTGQAPLQSPPTEKWRSRVPKALCRAVSRCLEKNPRDRFGSYDDLRKALLVHAAATPGPATLGARFLAGCIDVALFVPVGFYLFANIQGWSGTALFYGLQLLCLGGFEGIWGATPGKFLFRLRTVRRETNRPHLPRAFLRAAIFLALFPLAYDLVAVGIGMGSEDDFSENQFQTAELLYAGLAPFGFLGLLFITARKRNGYAAIHDLLSMTRVISKTAAVARPKTSAPVESPAVLDTAPRIGPYCILREIARDDGTTTLLACDPRLRRNVWIRQLPPETPEVPAELRNLARPGRLRWLTGKRSNTDSWDAYQALGGQPLLNAIAHPRGWDVVRFWMHDLAEELLAVSQKGSPMAVLSVDHLWLGADGRVTLLDFPAPGVERVSATLADATPAPGRFLLQVVLSALRGRLVSRTATHPEVVSGGLHRAKARCYGSIRPSPDDGASAKPGCTGETAVGKVEIDIPLPLHARSFLETLRAEIGLEEIQRQLESMLSQRTTVSHARRLALLAGCLAGPLALTATVMLLDGPGAPQDIPSMLVLTWVYGLAVAILPCWAAALLFRGGALSRGLGVAVVTRKGARASRGRVLWRNLFAMLPFAILPLIAYVALDQNGTLTAILSLALLAAVTTISILLPRRTLQDRLAGTFLVPR